MGVMPPKVAGADLVMVSGITRPSSGAAKMSRCAATPDEFVEGALALIDIGDDGAPAGTRRGDDLPGGERERKGFTPH